MNYFCHLYSSHLNGFLNVAQTVFKYLICDCNTHDITACTYLLPLLVPKTSHHMFWMCSLHWMNKFCKLLIIFLLFHKVVSIGECWTNLFFHRFRWALIKLRFFHGLRLFHRNQLTKKNMISAFFKLKLWYLLIR